MNKKIFHFTSKFPINTEYTLQIVPLPTAEHSPEYRSQVHETLLILGKVHTIGCGKVWGYCKCKNENKRAASAEKTKYNLHYKRANCHPPDC